VTAQPILFHWEGDVMRPVGRFAALADKAFVVGENYSLEVIQQRSRATHTHFFACVDEAFANLPEIHAGRWRTPDHLRRWALIQAGYRNETNYMAKSKAEALRFAPFLSGLDEYALVDVHGNMVAVYTAKSQSEKNMSRKEFQESKQACLDVIANLIGVSPDDLAGNARSVA
jgi:hypothetical protein